MTKTKKLFKTFALLLVLPLTFIFVGCIGSPTHEASNTWVKNDQFHWLECACGEDSCNKTYDIAAHTFIDGAPIYTATKTTTPQMCSTCGQTHEIINQTEEQKYNVILGLIEDYKNCEKTFTIKKDNENAITFNNSTLMLYDYEYDYFIYNKDGKYYHNSGGLETECTEQQFKNGMINVISNFFQVPAYNVFQTQIESSITKSLAGVYTLKVTEPNPVSPYQEVKSVITFTDNEILTSDLVIDGSHNISINITNDFDTAVLDQLN